MKKENAARGVPRGGLRALKARFRQEVAMDGRALCPWSGRAEQAPT